MTFAPARWPLCSGFCWPRHLREVRFGRKRRRSIGRDRRRRFWRGKTGERHRFGPAHRCKFGEIPNRPTLREILAMETRAQGITQFAETFFFVSDGITPKEVK